MKNLTLILCLFTFLSVSAQEAFNPKPGEFFVMKQKSSDDRMFNSEFVKVMHVKENGQIEVLFSKDVVGYPDWMVGKFKTQNGKSKFFAEPQTSKFSSQNESVYSTMAKVYKQYAVHGKQYKEAYEILNDLSKNDEGIEYIKENGIVKAVLPKKMAKSSEMKRIFDSEITKITKDEVEKYKNQLSVDINNACGNLKVNKSMTKKMGSNSVVAQVKCGDFTLNVICKSQYEKDTAKCLLDKTTTLNTTGITNEDVEMYNKQVITE